MSNPLSNPNEWQDQAGDTPPTEWDGTQFHWMISDGRFPSLTYIGAFPSPAFRALFLLNSAEFGNQFIAIVADGVTTSYELDVGVAMPVDVPACTESLVIKPGTFGVLYGDVTIAADEIPAFWHDFEECTEQ